MVTLKLTSPLTKGKLVKEAQRALKEYGVWVGPIDGVFGERTARAAAQAKWMLGYQERHCTQVYGPVLHSYLTGKKKPTLLMKRRAEKRKKSPAVFMRLEATRIAQSFEGMKESPANSNRVLFSSWYGMVGPWCAMFVTYCFVKAGSKAFSQGRRWAYCPYMVNDARAQRNGLTVVPKENVQTGDIAMFDWQGDGVSDHVGIVVTPPNSKGAFKAVEGNTSTSSDSDGGQVMIRDRNTKQVQVFIRVME
jgi:hypothetical protein